MKADNGLWYIDSCAIRPPQFHVFWATFVFLCAESFAPLHRSDRNGQQSIDRNPAYHGDNCWHYGFNSNFRNRLTKALRMAIRRLVYRFQCFFSGGFYLRFKIHKLLWYTRSQMQVLNREQEHRPIAKVVKFSPVFLLFRDEFSAKLKVLRYTIY